jgi:hypothetical protein
MFDGIGIFFAAASIALVHTVVGPDHYVPFAVMAKARCWSRTRMTVVTVACGLGHVLGSGLLGLVGVALGLALGQLEAFESSRGALAAWCLLGFGLAYSVWGLRRALRHHPHGRWHVHEEQSLLHRHNGTPNGARHTHRSAADLTPWILFVIFVFGPCEPLIPLLMYAAAVGDMAGALGVWAVFAVVTVATMVALVFVATKGIDLWPGKLRLDRYAHALAGATLSLCGLAMLLGL